MDWFLVGVVVAVGIGAWRYFRRPYGGSKHTTDYVANKGMANSFMGDMRTDTVNKLADPQYPKKKRP